MTEAESVNSNGFHVGDDEEMTHYKKDAINVVSFKLVYSKNDWQNSTKTNNFKPDMAHQIFGESESIFGYRSLAINLYYIHNSAKCFVDIQSSGAIKNSVLYQPDDIMERLNPWLPENFTTKKEEFNEMLKNEKHSTIFGKQLNSFKIKNDSSFFQGVKVSANYTVTICDTKDEEFKDFHRRFETFIVWFIDAANFIDLDDERWMLFYVYEELEDPETKEEYRSPVGFCSVYKFFAYPDNVRSRISQFFILPSHQKRGIGTKLFESVIEYIKKMPEVIDITVEEPTSTFQKMRDLYDSVIIHKELKMANLNVNTSGDKKVFEVMKKQKICKRQCQRIYDILGCCEALNSSKKEYEKYILEIRSRISSDIEKETRGSKRLCNMLRAGVAMERPDQSALIETEFKKYIEDLEPSINNLRKILSA